LRAAASVLQPTGMSAPGERPFGRRRPVSEHEKPQFDPSRTGISTGPNDTPTDDAVPVPAEVPEEATHVCPGPERMTPRLADKDQAARTGQGGLGETERAPPSCTGE